MRVSYAQLAEQSPLEVRAQIEPGAVVGVMGETGTFATGRHLHLSCYTRVSEQHHWGFANQRFFDPLPYIGKVFDPESVTGVELSTIVGGGLIRNVLKYAALGENLSSVTVTDGGDMVVYVPGAPAFVNADFLELFPAEWMPEGRAVLLADRDN